MTSNHPDKSKVHEYMARRVEQQRTKEHTPPPTPEQIRRELGWLLVPSNNRD